MRATVLATLGRVLPEPLATADEVLSGRPACVESTGCEMAIASVVAAVERLRCAFCFFTSTSSRVCLPATDADTGSNAPHCHGSCACSLPDTRPLPETLPSCATLALSVLETTPRPHTRPPLPRPRPRTTQSKTAPLPLLLDNRIPVHVPPALPSVLSPGTGVFFTRLSSMPRQRLAQRRKRYI
jgi:hypothetical protein